MEELESFHEQMLGVPLLMRIWVELVRNDYIGAAQPATHFEGLFVGGGDGGMGRWGGGLSSSYSVVYNHYSFAFKFLLNLNLALFWGVFVFIVLDSA